MREANKTQKPTTQKAKEQTDRQTDGQTDKRTDRCHDRTSFDATGAYQHLTKIKMLKIPTNSVTTRHLATGTTLLEKAGTNENNQHMTLTTPPRTTAKN